jgi:hypothetical protein
VIVDLDKKWMPQAGCTNTRPEVFFVDIGSETLAHPSAKVQAKWNRAKRVCERCPVMKLCARDSLGEVEGVWGGLDPKQRLDLRAKHSVNVRKLTGPLKIEYAKLAHTLRVNYRYPVSDVGRIIGISAPTATYLHDWYEAHLKELAEQDEAAREAVGAEEMADVIELAPVPFPTKAPSHGDCWVRYGRRVVAGYYLGQTEDDLWYCAKIKLAHEHSVSWIKAQDFKMCRAHHRNIMNRVGNGSRIYGTTITPGARRKQEAG